MVTTSRGKSIFVMRSVAVRRYWLLAPLMVTLVLTTVGCMTTETRYRSNPEQRERRIPYEHSETRYHTLEPLLPYDGFTIAFVGFGGGSDAAAERIQEAIKNGFETEGRNAKNVVDNIRVIYRSELLRQLTRTQLDNMGPEIESVLRRQFGVHFVCTGVVLSESVYRVSIEVLQYSNGSVYRRQFDGSGWTDVGRQIAQAFFGTQLEPYKFTETKYKTETYTENNREAYQVQVVDWGSTTLLIVLILAALLSAA